MSARGDPEFARVLDEVAREDELGRGYGRLGAAFGHPFATFAPPVEAQPAADGGAVEPWDQALAWLGETPEPAAPPKVKALPSDEPASIAAELGLGSGLGARELRRARRRFMWSNHPDRNPDAPSDLANRRVAIANMLVDRALEELARGRRSR